MAKGNDGRASRKKITWQLLWVFGGFLCLIIVLFLFGGRSNSSNNNNNNQLRDTPVSRAREHLGRLRNAGAEEALENRNDLKDQFSEKSEGELLESVLSGHLHLVDLHVVQEEMSRAPSNSYAGIYGMFCRLDWSLHKKDPSAVPMFRDLVANSDDCSKKWKLDLHKMAELARHRDAMADGKVKPLNLTAVVFHESRCGSTLVANMLAAMDPAKHRAYSESQPAATALHSVCQDDFSRCTEQQASMILRDTIYLMSRTDDPLEERVFFKFQSATTKSIRTFQMAFPDTPWMFIYRDPVQVMMSHVKDDPELVKALCTRTRKSPPPDIRAIAKRHQSDAHMIPGEEYCAAHLAAITEAAVHVLNDYAIPVDYQTMPDILWERILPKVFGRPLTPTEIGNMDQISHQYSKGRGQKHKEFKGDSEQKEEKASNQVHRAAKKYLQESFDQLAEFEPKLLQ